MPATIIHEATMASRMGRFILVIPPAPIESSAGPDLLQELRQAIARLPDLVLDGCRRPVLVAVRERHGPLGMRAGTVRDAAPGPDPEVRVRPGGNRQDFAGPRAGTPA